MNKIILRTKIKEIYLFFRRISLLYFISPLLPKSKDSFSLQKIERILVIRIDNRIGDLILSTPTLRALREKFPQADITLILNPGTKDLAKAVPWIDKVVVYRNLIQAVRILRQENFDLAIDLLMNYSLKSALLAFLSGAIHRLGYAIQGREAFFNIRVKPDDKERPMIERTLDVLRPIGVDRLDKNPDIVLLDEDKRYIEGFLKEQGIFDDLLVGIHPGGHYPSQRWLSDRFAQLADEIIVRYGAKVILIGGLNEEDLVRRVINLMRQGASEIVGIPLNRLSALIARCDLFVCNNSGPLHIATAVRTPTVSTMGPSVPYLWWPQGENHIVVRKDLPCSPCPYGVCKSQQCMRLITVEDMMEGVKLQLERIKGRIK